MTRMDAVVTWLLLDEIPAALRLLSVMEEFGQIRADEAAEWRRRIVAWGRYHAVEGEAAADA